MSIRSHVDPSTFVRILYIDSTGLDADAVRVLEHESDPEAFWKLWSSERERRADSYFHETYHFWQGIRLPYLHRYAILSLRNIYVAFRFGARELGPDVAQWSFEIPELYMLTNAIEVFVGHNRSLAIRALPSIPAPDDAQAVFRLSERDLLEAGASLAEWQFYASTRYRELSALINPTYFRRWRKSRPAFLEAFDLIALTLADEALALRCALPMICAAFFTTYPLRALCELAATLSRWLHDGRPDWLQQFIRQPEPCQWVSLMDMLLNHIEFDAPPDSETEVSILAKKFYRLTIENWAYGNYADQFTLHPFLSEGAQEWLKAEKSTLPGLQWLLGQPGWVTPETLEFAREIEPPLTVGRISLPNGRTRVISFRDYRQKQGFWGMNAFGGGELLDLMTVISVIKRVTGSHYHPAHRLCSHAECPHYQANFCNTYIKVPDRFEECGFPERLRRNLIKHGPDGGL
jgi:hypothetical protein